MRFTGLVLALLLSVVNASTAEQRQVVIDKPQVRVEAILHFQSVKCGEIRPCTQLSIINKSPWRITAWGDLEYTNPHGSERLPDFIGSGMMDYLTSDFGISPNAPGIEPRATRQTILSDCDGVVMKAVIFANGSTLGDATWVRSIIEERRRVYRDASLALNTLTVDKGSAVSIKNVVAQFRSLAKKEHERQRRPMSFSDPSTMIAPPAIFANIEVNLARLEREPTATQHQAIDFFCRSMRNLLHRLLVSRPTIGVPSQRARH